MWFPIQFLSFYLSNQLYWYIPSFTKKNLEVLRFFISTGCRARQLWLLARHGTRNPGTKAMKKMAHHLPLLREFILENHLHGSGSLCSDDRKLTETTFNGYSNKVKLLFLTVKNLQKWRFRAVVDENKYLVDEGFDAEDGKQGRQGRGDGCLCSLGGEERLRMNVCYVHLNT